MGKPTRTRARSHDERSDSLGELIHAAVRRAIEVAVDEELTATLGARLSFAKTLSRRSTRVRIPSDGPREGGLSATEAISFAGKTKVFMWRTEAVRREGWDRLRAVVAVRTGQPVLDYAARRT
jgi:hypothetical protein